MTGTLAPAVPRAGLVLRASEVGAAEAGVTKSQCLRSLWGGPHRSLLIRRCSPKHVACVVQIQLFERAEETVFVEAVSDVAVVAELTD